jgi:hypothetical protein
MGSRTFLILDEEQPAKDAIGLLGRVVAQPRRPFDGFRPQKSVPQTDADTDSDTSRRAFLADQTLRVKVERKAKVTAKTIRTGEAHARLTKFFGFGAKTEANATYNLSSDYIKTIALDQYEDTYKILRQNYESEVSELMDKVDGPVYMMVALKTALNPEYRRHASGEASGEGHVRVPVDKIAGQPIPALGEIGGDVTMKLDKTSTLEATAEEEVAFAAEYCEIVRISTYEFHLKSRPSRRIKEKIKPVSRWSGKHLAFGGVESDSAEDDRNVGSEDKGDGYIEDTYC